MSDSDSPLSDISPTIPDDTRIEKQLRAVVISTFAKKDFDNLTVKRVRSAAASKLDVPEDFFTEGRWKARSKEIISAEVAKQEETVEQTATSPAKPTSKPKPKRSKPTAATKQQKEKPAPEKKRKSTESQPKPKPAKRRKTIDSSPALVHSDSEDEVVAKKRGDNPSTPSTPAKKNKTHTASSPIPTPTSAPREEQQQEEQDDTTPLSSPLDSTPPPTKRKSTSSKPSSKPSASTTSKPPKSSTTPSANTNTTTDPELKKLQSHLQKCGIRKLWGKELSSFPSNSQKIKHLKSLLEGAGMTGRFSEEKARQIREERELRADLEDITRGEERWGLDLDGAGASGGRRRSRGARGRVRDESESESDDGVEDDGDEDAEGSGGDEDEDGEDGEGNGESNSVLANEAKRRRLLQRRILEVVGDDEESD